MPEKYTYLLVDILCLLFPLGFSFHPRLEFHKQWRFFVVPCLLTGTFFVIWDILFTRIGVWSFNPRYLMGAWLWGLPLEEYLFFFCIPYACVFTYYSINRYYNLVAYSTTTRNISAGLALILSATALAHLSQLYTSATFLLRSLLLMLLIAGRARFLAGFFVSFLVILVPFFISNGILTGSGLAEPVVRYNDNYNLHIRLMTIPLEDVFYGMLLLLLNVAGFEYMAGRSGR